MISRRRFGVLSVAAALTATPAISAETKDVLPAGIDDLIRIGPRAGGFVAVTHKGKLIGFKPWGEASIPFHQPVTAHTLFNIGSGGKQVTGVAIRQLAASGTISLQAPVGDYVSGLPKQWNALSVGSLLAHTSGLPDYLAVMPDMSRPKPKALVVETMGVKPLAFEEGTAFHYSNTNYLILGWLVSEVTKQPLGQYVAGQVFSAAGAPHARGEAAGDIIENRAEPYTLEGDRIVHATAMDPEVSATGDGGILVSALDAAPWRRALETPDQLLPGIYADRLGPEALKTGVEVPYAAGFYLDQTRGKVIHDSGGWVWGYRALWRSMPGEHLSVLVASNLDATSTNTMSTIANVILDKLSKGGTFWSLPQKPTDDRALLIKSVLSRPTPEVDPSILASSVHSASIRQLGSAINAIGEIESYPVTGGEMVRYRIQSPRGLTHVRAGFTKAGKLFWLL